MSQYSIMASLTGQPEAVARRIKEWTYDSPIEAWGRKHALIGGGMVIDVQVRRDGARIEDVELERDIAKFVRGR